MPEAQNAPGCPLLLVADDEPFVLEVLAQIAAEAGWRVRTTRDGHHLLRLASAHPDAAAILLDVRMPGPGSSTLIRALRHSHPSARLLLMSGDPGLLTGHHADDVLAKPFAPEDLLAALHHRHLSSAA